MKWKLVAAAALAVCFSAIIYEKLTLSRRGEATFARLGCGGCHFSGGGPNLTHVANKHSTALLEKFIQNPQNVYRERQGRPLNAGYMLMPNTNATHDDVQAIITYLQELNND
jgi:cytochrome c551/c552